MASLEEIAARIRAQSRSTQCRYDGTLPTDVRPSYNTPAARAHCHTGSTSVHSDGPTPKTERLTGSDPPHPQI